MIVKVVVIFSLLWHSDYNFILDVLLLRSLNFQGCKFPSDWPKIHENISQVFDEFKLQLFLENAELRIFRLLI